MTDMSRLGELYCQKPARVVPDFYVPARCAALFSLVQLGPHVLGSLHLSYLDGVGVLVTHPDGSQECYADAQDLAQCQPLAAHIAKEW